MDEVRKSCYEVIYVYIDDEGCYQEGTKYFKSSNGVERILKNEEHVCTLLEFKLRKINLVADFDAFVGIAKENA